MSGIKKSLYEPIRDSQRSSTRGQYTPPHLAPTAAAPSRIPPYDVEAGKFAILERHKMIWSSLDARARKIQILAVLQILLNLLVCLDGSWYTQVFGVAIGCIGLMAVRGDKVDVLMVYLFLCVFEFVKNVGYLQDAFVHLGNPAEPAPSLAARNMTDVIVAPSTPAPWFAFGLTHKYLIFQICLVCIEEFVLIPCVILMGYSSVQAVLRNY
ncbi:hypothetical protein SPRG_07698 [Saprolegnia parasitica CBS 223.65]|uniref:Uncharacterized protein n=1 Tax=Saprolegnia parasitica (strain CBS 223.65) TaxID=695850 RepID=A0A067CCS0_SAPPC|nr:hypothetical protein SPRG_07698 [Saprolegnia parasitica CBS 223.65]KDO26985.1 hypothetical protein SPRG_07698 [Saprolegnia parasitica CBS 223.65]|eukprot:XP_012202366.1 hypothetical protein SPRG_07698 [Saprolegnia parasitica CBS 223.65]